MSFFLADRRGYCGTAESLDLMQEDPHNRIIYSLPGYHSQEDSKALIQRSFPGGLSMHGWQYLASRHDFVKTAKGDVLWDHSTSVEVLFEAVRRAQYPALLSRFQSYFAWLTLEDALEFCPPGKLIYEVEASSYHVADMRLLTLSVQGVIAMLYAEKYWRGDITKNPQKEVLLCPPVSIVGVVCGRA